MAQQFDLKRMETTGGAFPLADRFVQTSMLTGPFSVSAVGSLAYSRTVSLNFLLPPTAQLAWSDRAGKQLGLAGPEGPYLASLIASLSSGLTDLRFGGSPALSPDGQFVAFSRDNPPDIWVLDIEKGLTSRLTSSPAADSYPVWSPDGKKVAFRSERDGSGNVYVRGVDDVGEEKPLLQDEASKFPTDWTDNGRFLIYHTADGDIWALPMTGEQADRKPLRITQTPFVESDAKVSPDGHWIAYLSNEPGHVEVYVQSFPQPGFKQPVSTEGGFMPRWSPDGKELFYNTIGTLFSVSIKPLGSSIQIGAPVPVFPIRGPMNNVTKSGRFLTTIIGAGQRANPLTPDNIVVIHNWAQAKTEANR
jgi:Tol biopolymer transport system component